MYEEILSGRTTRERKLAVCTGSARLPVSERAELLTVLAEDADELVRERAANGLLSQPVEGFVEALQGEAPAPHLFRHCGRHLLKNGEISAAMLQHRRCPQEFLIGAARSASPSAVQNLMQDLDRLSISPMLVAALLRSSSLTAEQQQQLHELQKETTEAQDAFAEAAAEAEPDKARRLTLLQRLSRMRVVERMQLALKGNREERLALIRDPCKVVQRAVLQSSRISEREVEAFAAMANLSDEVLRLIAANRNFRRNYTVVRNLINNPKTPLDISLHLLPGINAQDLKALTTNKNVPDTLRSSAVRLQRQRAQTRQGQ